MSGRVVVMGSGELAPGLVATHRAGLEAAETDRVVVLDTPYGFQENADQLTERIATFFETSLRATVEIASLRNEQADTLDRERFVSAIRAGRYVFSGPGSPSYALRVWQDIAVAPALQAVVEGGGTVAFASAASLTLGRTTIPVYEMYKVGEAPHWLDGLDIMSPLGLPCTVVPHWNNTEGGNHDTSHCYIGGRRFGQLERSLDVGVVGVDEHTAATIDFGQGQIAASGNSRVTLRGSEEVLIGNGETISLDAARQLLGTRIANPLEEAGSAPKRVAFADAIAGYDPDAVLEALLEAETVAAESEEGRRQLRALLVETVAAAQTGLNDPKEQIEGFVDLLLELRSSARDRGDYAAADQIRDRLHALGIEVRDTVDGTNWELKTN